MRNDDNYCKHGVYVGGCGIDYMCGYCESGYTDEEYSEYIRNKRLRRMHMRTVEALTKRLTYRNGDVVYNNVYWRLFAQCKIRF